jgi:hypothetical protein
MMDGGVDGVATMVAAGTADHSGKHRNLHLHLHLYLYLYL